MQRLLTATAILASVLIGHASPVLAADPLGIDKKIDEVIDNATKEPPAESADKPAANGAAYRNPAPERRQGPLIPDEIRQDSPPTVRPLKFSERFKTEDDYEKAVLAALASKDPAQFGDPNGDGVKLAKIIIQSEFPSETEPETAAEHIKEAVDRFAKGRQDSAEIRKKASQRIARRSGSALREAVGDPSLAPDAQPDYGAIASTLLSIGGAAIPMMRGGGSVSHSIRVPQARTITTTPVVRVPTTPSTITGTR
jgi:hypothetical protein